MILLKRLFLVIVFVFTSMAAIATTDALVMKENSYTRTANDLTIYGELGDSGGYYTYRGVNYYNLSDIELRYQKATYTAYYEGACIWTSGYHYLKEWTRNSEIEISSFLRIDGNVSITEDAEKIGGSKLVYNSCSSISEDNEFDTNLEWFNPKTQVWDSSVTSYSSSDSRYTADTTPPMIESDIYSWEMGLGDPIPNLINGVTVFDKFDNNPSITVNTSSVKRHQAGVYTVTYYVSDKNGNSTYINGSITVIDNRNPTLTVEENHIYIRVKTGEWGTSANDMNLINVKDSVEDFVTCKDDDERGCTLTNNVAGQITWTTVNSGYQVVYIFSDPSGNISYESVIIHVIDDIAPTIVESDIYSWEMNIGEKIPDLLEGVKLYDNYDNSPTISVDASKVNVNRADVYTITYTITDKYGNSSKVNGAITVNDVTPPELTKNVSHIYIRVDTNQWGYSINDIVNIGDPNWESFITCKDDDSRGCTLTNSISLQIDWDTVSAGYKVYYNYKDSSGNIVIDFITVHVIDDTPPIIVNTDIYSWEMKIGETIPDLITGVTLYDKWDSMPVISVDTSNVNINRAGVYTITYYVVDKYGNGAHIDGSITVNDITPPELTKSVEHIYIRVDTNEWGYSFDQIINTSMPIWSQFITCIDDDEVGCFLINDIASQVDWNTVNPGFQVIYRFKDNSGNMVTDSIVVHVIDDTAPTIDNSDILDGWVFNIGAEITEDMLKDNIVISDNTDNGAYIDRVDFSNVNVYSTGSYSITYHIKDKYNNSTTYEGTVTINDVTPPTLTKNINRIYIRVGTDEWGYSLDGIIYTGQPDWSLFITCNDDDDKGCYLVNDIASQVNWDVLNSGYQVIYVFRDMSGNEMSQTITIHVIDDTAPTIESSIIDDWYFTIGTEITEDMLKENVLVIDNTDLNAHIDWVDFSEVNVNLAGIYNITYYIIDGSGNSGVAYGKVTIADVTPPKLTKNINKIYIRVGTNEWGYSLNEIIYTVQPAWDTFVTCEDDDEAGCYLVNDVAAQVDWNTLNSGYQIIYVFSDMTGNQMSQTITIHVIDDTAPIIESSIIDDWTYTIGTNITEHMLKEGVIVVDDTDKYAYIDWIDFSTVNIDRAGIYEIIYHISDSSGNSGVTHGKLTIVDVTPPTLVRKVNRIFIRVGTDEWGYTLGNMDNIGDPDWASFIECSDDDERGCILLNDVGSQIDWNTVDSGYQVIYNFRDFSGNLVNQAITVHIVDDVSPIVEVNSIIDVDIEDLEGYDWSQHLTIKDNYYKDGFSIDVDLKDLVGVNANNPSIQNYVSYSVSDMAGNITETGKVEVTLRDRTPPYIELTEEFIYVLRTDSQHDFSKYIIDVTDNSGINFEDFNIVYSTLSNGYMKHKAATIYIDINEINFNIPRNYNITYYVTDYSNNTYVSSGRIVTISNFAGDVSTIDTLIDDDGTYGFEYGSDWNIFEGVTAFDREGNSVVSDVQVAMTYYDGEKFSESKEIDWSTLGRYTLVYYYIDEESQISFVLGRRTVEIIDTQAPELKGYRDINMELGDELTREFVLREVTAIDGYDGDITDKVEVLGLSTLSIGNNTITLEVEDSSGNKTAATINVYVEARNTLSKYSLLLGVGGLAVVGGFIYIKSKGTAL